MEIQVIVENTTENTKIKGKHGLSLLIKTNDNLILYDFGPKNSLRSNSKKLCLTLEDVDLTVLSHNHIDHGGDINYFCKINKKAMIHVNTDLSDKLYTKLLSVIKFPVAIKLKNIFENRIVIHNSSEEIVKNVFVLKLSKYSHESTLNKDLYIIRNNKFVEDDFEHESALIINDDDDELVVFCACSHHGVSNIVEDVKKYFPNKKIKAFVGGFHMCNPISKKNEPAEYIEKEIQKLKQYKINYYTGHCTGEFAFNILKNELNNEMNRISTAMIINM